MSLETYSTRSTTQIRLQDEFYFWPHKIMSNHTKASKLLDLFGKWRKKVSSIRSYKCTICDDNSESAFAKKSLLQKHIKEYHSDIFCSFCASCWFKTQSDLEEHVKIFHSFRCKLCTNSQIFTSKSTLEDHIRAHHHTLKCKFCDPEKYGNIFSKMSLEEHMKLCHQFICTYREDNKNFASKPIFQTKTGLEKHISVLHKCGLCKNGEIFQTINEKMEHVKLHRKHLEIFVSKCPWLPTFNAKLSTCLYICT